MLIDSGWYAKDYLRVNPERTNWSLSLYYCWISAGCLLFCSSEKSKQRLKMLCLSRASHAILLFCVLFLCVESVMCGTSFLSPIQRPLGRGDRKPHRLGRRATAEAEAPVDPETNQIVISSPFHVGVSLTEAEYLEFGQVLQKILLDVLGDSPPLE